MTTGAIDLTGIKLRRAVPMQLRFGTVTEPPQGGEDEQIGRLGDRWAFQFETIPMAYEPAGREMAALLGRGRRAGVIVPVTPPTFVIGAAGTPTVSADTPSGRFIPLASVTASYAVRAGQWLNYFGADGLRYLERVSVAVTASGGGAATVEIENLLRFPQESGDAINLLTPCIEGRIVGDVGEAWDRDGHIVFSFTVRETA